MTKFAPHWWHSEIAQPGIDRARSSHRIVLSDGRLGLLPSGVPTLRPVSQLFTHRFGYPAAAVHHCLKLLEIE